MEKPRKFTKKEILLHKQNGTLEELFNPDGSEIDGGIPKNLGDVVTVEPGDSLDKKATQAMNQQDKMGFIRTNNVLLRRESKFNETFLEEVNKLNEEVDILQPTTENQPTSIETIQHNRPEVFLKVDTFVSDIQSFELTPEEQGVIGEYITTNLK
jgi:hypothetical protein